MEAQELIEQARRRFDNELHTDTYRVVHSDATHLAALMNLLEARPDGRYLDLGTGNGYLAFEMAHRFPNTMVIGLDIARQSIQINQEYQQVQGIRNLEFVSYDGLQLPFEASWFDGVISRYVFHHFPKAAFSVKELHRIIKLNGFVIISDPMTHEDDRGDFVDKFQQLKADGHVHFYREQEMDTLFQGQGFIKETCYYSEVSYPRELNEAYIQLFDETPSEILRKYGIDICGDVVHITVRVLNVMYRKIGRK